MSSEDNKAVVRTFFAGLNHGNLDIVDQVCAENYRVHFPGTPGPMDRANVKLFWGGFFGAFPGIQHTIEDIVAEGDKVAIRMVIQGVHRGDFQGIPPTGKQITIGALNIYHFSGGKIVEQWVEYDAVGMLQQLGVMAVSVPA